MQEPLQAEYLLLSDDEGISGFVVSRKFEGMSALSRQEEIDAVRRGGGLSDEERRHVVMIAGLTPDEYDFVGTRIRVHKIKEFAGGWLEIVLRGMQSDAQYVRGALNNLKGVQTTDPQPVNDASGILLKFRAKGSGANPLTKSKALSTLKKDRYIEIMQGV